MEPKITVIADDREACAGVVQPVLARPDCEVIIRRLPTKGPAYTLSACAS